MHLLSKCHQGCLPIFFTDPVRYHSGVVANHCREVEKHFRTAVASYEVKDSPLVEVVLDAVGLSASAKGINRGDVPYIAVEIA